MWNMHDGFGWWAVFGTGWMVLFWAAIAWLVVSVFSRGRPGDERRGRGLTAREIADQRYARGEMSREEYLRVVDDLTRPVGGSPGGAP